VVMGSEGTALRMVNWSVDGISKAVAEIGKEVKEMRMLNGYGTRKEVKMHWSEFLRKKREEDRLASIMVSMDGVVMGLVGGVDGVTFTTKVKKENDGSSWFPKEPVGPLFPPGGAAIATVTPGGKKRGTWATKEEALKALGYSKGGGKESEWMDEE